jgi:hypothetical protein
MKKKLHRRIWNKAYRMAVFSRETGGRIYLPVLSYTYKKCTPRKILNLETDKINTN